LLETTFSGRRQRVGRRRRADSTQAGPGWTRAAFHLDDVTRLIVNGCTDFLICRTTRRRSPCPSTDSDHVNSSPAGGTSARHRTAPHGAARDAAGSSVGRRKQTVSARGPCGAAAGLSSSSDQRQSDETASFRRLQRQTAPCTESVTSSLAAAQQ